MTRQFTLYFGVALLGLIVDFCSLIVAREVFGLHYLIAATIGFTLGLIVVYALSSRYVFGKSKVNSKVAEFALFTVIGVIGLAMLNVLMWVFTDIFSVYYIVSKVLATVFVYCWNFFARRALYHS